MQISLQTERDWYGGANKHIFQFYFGRHQQGYYIIWLKLSNQ